MPTATSLADALRFAHRGELDEAREVLTALLEVPGHPDAPQAATLLGRIHLQQKDVDGALDALVPAWERARRSADPAPAALVGLGLVQALVAADRALHGLRVLVQARSYSELAGNPGLLSACNDLGTALLERIPSPDDASTADSRATRTHLQALARRASGDLPGSRRDLQNAWTAAEAAAPIVLAEVGLDLVHRMMTDGNMAWPTVRTAARTAAASAQDPELVAQFDAIEMPESAPVDDDAGPLDRARALAERGSIDAAIDACEAVLADGNATPGDRLSARCLLAQVHLGADRADRAVAALAPAWARLESGQDPIGAAGVASLLGPALVADGRTLSGLRVLMVARHHARDDADTCGSLVAIGERLRPHLPDPPSSSEDPDRAALLHAARALIAWLGGHGDEARAGMGFAWAAAKTGSANARAQVALDYTGMLRASDDPRWMTVQREGRAAAMEVGDGNLVALFDAVTPIPEA